MTYDNTNKGAMWRNMDKQSDTHPDFKGSINIDGVEYWLSGWSKKQGDNPNAPSVKFSYQAKEQVHNQGYQQANHVMQQPQRQAPQQRQVPQQRQAPQQRPQEQYQEPAPIYDDFNDDIPF